MDDYVSLWGAIYGIFIMIVTIIAKMKNSNISLDKIHIQRTNNAKLLDKEKMKNEPHQWANIILKLCLNNFSLQHALFKSISKMFNGFINIGEFQLHTDYIHKPSINNIKQNLGLYIVDIDLSGITIQGICHINIINIFNFEYRVSITLNNFNGLIQINTKEPNIIEISLDYDFVIDLDVNIQLESNIYNDLTGYKDVDEILSLEMNLEKWIKNRFLEIIEELKWPNGIHIYYF